MLLASGHSRPRWSALVLRALLSTVIICVVALGFAMLRAGRFQFSDVKVACLRYWPLPIAVFSGVLPRIK